MMIALFDSVEGFIVGFVLSSMRHRNRAKKSEKEKTEQWVYESVVYLL